MTTHPLTVSREAPANAIGAELRRALREMYYLADPQSRRARPRARVERGEGLGPIHYGDRRSSTRARRAGMAGVRPDPRTASLVQWAFQTFAGRDFTVAQLGAELAEQATQGNPRRVTKLPSYRRLRAILQDPSYVGAVRFDGAEYPGAHEPLISTDLFARVQERLRARRLRSDEQI